MIRSSVMVSAMNGASKSNLIAWPVQCLSRRFLYVLLLVAFISEGGRLFRRLLLSVRRHASVYFVGLFGQII